MIVEKVQSSSGDWSCEKTAVIPDSSDTLEYCVYIFESYHVPDPLDPDPLNVLSVEF